MNPACCPSKPETSDSPPFEEKPAHDKEMAQLAWGIAHPARVRILRILLAKKACICGDLVELMPLAQSTVSQHLKILKECGLVQGEIQGPKVCYCVNPQGYARLKELMAGL